MSKFIEVTLSLLDGFSVTMELFGLTLLFALPLGLISQYMPVQFERLSRNELHATPHALILDRIQDVLRAYRCGCSPDIV